VTVRALVLILAAALPFIVAPLSHRLLTSVLRCGIPVDGLAIGTSIDPLGHNACGTLGSRVGIGDRHAQHAADWERNRAAVLGFRRRSAFRYPEDPFVGTRAHNQSPHRVAGEKKVGMMLGYG
jgi:hypothetical protein